MKIISWNVNGLKSAFEKGFFDFLEKEKPEILCLQEIRFLGFFEAKIKDYFAYFNCAKRKGFWGTAVFTKQKPKNVERKLGFERFDSEGRFLKLDFGNFSLINVYLPHGGRKKENLGYKLEAFKELRKYLKNLKRKSLILAGDFNVAHKEQDLARPKENKNSIMFLPKERKQIDKILEIGFFDSFRYLNKDKKEFTWYLKAFNCKKHWLENRLHFLTKDFLPKMKEAKILKDVEISDHLPTSILINDRG